MFNVGVGDEFPVVPVGRKDVEDDVGVVSDDGLVTPHHGLSEAHRLSGVDKVIEYIHAPFVTIPSYQLLCKKRILLHSIFVGAAISPKIDLSKIF